MLRIGTGLTTCCPGEERCCRSAADSAARRSEGVCPRGGGEAPPFSRGEVYTLTGVTRCEATLFALSFDMASIAVPMASNHSSTSRLVSTEKKKSLPRAWTTKACGRLPTAIPDGQRAHCALPSGILSMALTLGLVGDEPALRGGGPPGHLESWREETHSAQLVLPTRTSESHFASHGVASHGSRCE